MTATPGDSRGVPAAPDRDPAFPTAPVAGPGALDPDRLALAVGELIRAIDPQLSAQVRVEIHPPKVHPPVNDPPLNPPVSDPPAKKSLPAGTQRRRADGGEAPARAVAPGGSDLQLDLVGRTLTVDGAAVLLTRREFDLLAYLQNRRGAALGRRELMNAVWQTGYLAGDRTIDVHVRRLRVKLGSQADRLTTLRGYGYRFD